MKGWAAKELATLDLGEVRRERRLLKIVETLAAQPATSVPQACGNGAATKATYEVWKSPRVKTEAIYQAHQQSTVARRHQHKIV